jgi:3-oxoacyl-[acyl-carrier protein] reductase
MNISTKPLTGKVALVTGGSRSIGAAIVKKLAADGAAVALTFSSSSKKADELVRAVESDGGRALAIRADNADATAVKNAVAETVKAFGRLDILVNNAGIATFKPIDDLSVEDFDRIVAVNIRGAFVATQAAVRHMRDGGRIINIGSCNSDYVPFAGGSLYAMTKAALVGLTKGLARDLGPLGITVTNVQPGPTDTDMNPADSDWGKQTLPHLAIKRYAKPDEIANFVAYLASPAVSYITGASLRIDGGYAA